MSDSFDAETEEMERMFEEVRQRFIQSLDERMKNTEAAVARAVGDGEAAADGVERGYKELHTFCGMAGMVGFADLGSMARAALNVLSPARREKRGLEPAEVNQFQIPYQRLKAGIEGAVGR
ncbi:Hpt domain-containing protein [Rhizobium halophytocola]|uniref:Chemotaxis protein histidine kinase CheA n=1 Tax=Rhizobium halophytocola TaxID=735519 RepID=A0ABS4E6I1_9HYPH|nr:Hpt domain-containing protein [Rhizobium halophytocola]MBP1853552.1 chemotaxis protein histidine kinase CheA [Rhizobium halophytocola]